MVAAFVCIALVSGCRKKDLAVVDGGAPPGSAASASASAAKESAPADVPVRTAEPGARGKVTDDVPVVGKDDPKASFVDNRVRRAKAGETEIVSFRAWECGPSCTCPPPCTMLLAEDGRETWLDLRDDDGVAIKVPDWSRFDVTGRFTGRSRKSQGPLPEPVELPEVRIVGEPSVVGTAMSPELDGPAPKVVLSGPEASKLVPKVKDDKPWLVVAGSFPLADRERADEEAGKLFEKLGNLGIQDAERHDSRAFSGLSCCFEVVTGGRFADQKAAEARLKQLSAKGVKGYLKKGF
jgi:hypothetical protein